ncbi:MAG TPA: type 4a pilus biogenesis protein PilO [Tepidisphaeraceae bacterium]|jgi:type IV pilus assembly protein PilO
MKIGFREIIFLTLMAALLAVAFLFLKKTDQKRQRLLTDIRTEQAAITNLRTATAGIADLGKKLDELQQAITFFESKLPQEKEMDKILKEVWQMAEANSLQTKTIRTLKSERAATFSEQPISLSLSGDFNGYYSFLLQLEKLPRLTRVTSMRLEKISDREGEMTAQMQLSIFFEPDAVAAAN